MSAFLAIVVVGVSTYATRAVFIVGLAQRSIPPSAVRALEQVGPATLAALIVAMLTSDGQLQVGVPEAGGLAAAALVGLRWRNLIALFAAGMAAYWLLRLVV